MEIELYNSNRANRLVKKDTYRGLTYIIASCGTHPVAYVKIPRNHFFYRVRDKEVIYNFPAPCHGGITFVGTPSTIGVDFNKRDIWIGWDYAHAGDFYREGNGKKWTLEEIYEDVKTFINFLLESVANETTVESISPDDSTLVWKKSWSEEDIDLKHSIETILEKLGFEREE